MMKFTLKLLLLSLLSVSLSISSTANIANTKLVDGTCKTKADEYYKVYVQTIVNHTTEFVEFSSQWTEEFFNRKNHQPFCSFIDSLKAATAQFKDKVVNKIPRDLGTTFNDTAHTKPLKLGHELALMICTQAEHVCKILDANRNSQSATFVGLALKKVEQYTSASMLKELESKFWQFTVSLKNANQELASQVCQLGKDVLAKRKAQYSMGLDKKFKGLAHRLKCR